MHNSIIPSTPLPGQETDASYQSIFAGLGVTREQALG